MSEPVIRAGVGPSGDAPRPRWHAMPDGGTWPVPDDGLAELEWRLRYGTPTRSDLLTAASVMAAYRQLIEATEAQRNRVVRALREAQGR